MLLAEGINLGLRKMAEATTTHGSASWGTGRTASSDGQFFPAAGRGEALNLVNARYGAEPGVKVYSHVSDRFSPFATQTIPATVHEAPYILDGLLLNETGTRVREQYADTGGFTDHVFAACSILGYAFVPRIRDLPSKRLYVFDRAGVPKRLRPLGRRQGERGPDRPQLGGHPAPRGHHGRRDHAAQPDPAQARRVPAPERAGGRAAGGRTRPKQLRMRARRADRIAY